MPEDFGSGTGGSIDALHVFRQAVNEALSELVGIVSLCDPTMNDDPPCSECQQVFDQIYIAGYELAARLTRRDQQAEGELDVLVEEFVGWWHLNREGSVNAAYDYLDKMTKKLREALARRDAPQEQTMNVQQAPANQKPFEDTPLLATKRKAFDYPSQANLDALILEAQLETRFQDSVGRDADPAQGPKP